MTPEQIVEATLFASQVPLSPAELARADEALTPERVAEALQTLRARYEEEAHAFQIYQLGSGYQILTRPEYAPYLERCDAVARRGVLSRAALETLAIIAYRQPIGRLEVEGIRGVDSSTVLRTLQEWELIQVVGRAEGLGRPLLYGTTQRFLDHFGFASLTDLPRPDDLPVALRLPEERVEPARGPTPEETDEDRAGEGGEGLEMMDREEERPEPGEVLPEPGEVLPEPGEALSEPG
ncbi:MAG: SMC-Scp complex subunit ScpB, partial [Gemmatimonadota bacterium]